MVDDVVSAWLARQVFVECLETAVVANSHIGLAKVTRADCPSLGAGHGL